MKINKITKKTVERTILGGLPDIDADLPSEFRDVVKQNIRDKYGNDYVASVGTFNSLQLKGALKELNRVSARANPKDINYISSTIDKDARTYQDFISSAKTSRKLKKFVDENGDLVENIPPLLNNYKSQGTHSGAVIIIPKVEGENIYSTMPVRVDDDGHLVTEWEKDEVEEAGFLKLDLLVINQLNKFIETKKGLDIDLEKIPLDDEKTLQMFRDGNLGDVFQFGSTNLQLYTAQASPQSIEELIAIVSLYRPGTMDSNAHLKYIQLKKGEIEPEYDFGLEEVTKDTYGLFVYQEQIMQACQILGGFSLQETDDVRRAMGKKKADVIEAYNKQFVKGAVSKGCSEEEAKRIWKKMEVFSGYAFNRCLSGNTRIYKPKGGHGYAPTIAEMYKIKNDLQYAKDNGKIALRRKYRGKLGYGVGFSLNENNVLVKNRIVDIRYEGFRDVYEMTLSNGKSIICTDNHKFPTSNGNKELKDIDVSKDLIFFNVGHKVERTSYKFTDKSGSNNERYHDDSMQQKFEQNSRKGHRGFVTKSSTPRKMLLDYKKNHKKDYCENVDDCTKKSTRLEVHHIDNNHGNNKHSNLKTLCSSCHKKEHYKMGRVKMGEKGLSTELVSIKSIVHKGKEDVYDVEMTKPYHTFAIDNGIVTCNSHSVCYALTGYYSNWFKVHYPTRSWRTSLQWAKEEVMPLYISEINRLEGATLSPPNINTSTKKFESSLEDEEVYWSLPKIKHVGDKAVEAIIKEREENGEFFSLEEFMERVDTSKVNKRCMENMIISGCFDKMYNIEHPNQRRSVMQEYYDNHRSKKELMPEKFLSEHNFVWAIWQKEVCGLAEVNFEEVLEKLDKTKGDVKKYADPELFLQGEFNNKFCLVVGVVTEVTSKKIKNGEMGTITLDNNSNLITLRLWNSEWTRFKAKLEESKGKILAFVGKCAPPSVYNKTPILQSFSKSLYDLF